MKAILERELLSLFRSRQAFTVQLCVALMCAILIAVRWPSGARVDLAGARSREVFVLFGYAMLAALVLVVPSFPAASIVRERQQHTLTLLLHSPLRSSSIYFGKLVASLGFVLVLVSLSLPAAAACHAMGGISLGGQLLPLYGIYVVLAVQLAALGLWASSRSRAPDSALRLTYALVLALVLLPMAPSLFLRGADGMAAGLATTLQFLSPMPAVMSLLGQADVGLAGGDSSDHAVSMYVLYAAISTAGLGLVTIRRLSYRMLDGPKSTGVLTEDRAPLQRGFRRLVFLVDPHRRKAEIGAFVNPVLVKEFRSRQFGRLHWLLRLVAACALISMLLTWATTVQATTWGVEMIGAMIVVLQVALIVLLTPGLAGGLISGEHESGGWQLLRMTPLSAGVILRGKLMSVCLTMILILCATLPGYLVMVWINPLILEQVRQVIICLVLTAIFSIVLSVTVSSFFRRSARATAVSYALLLLLCGGTLLLWLGRDAPFGHGTVQAALMLNPMAAAFSVIGTPGFAQYELVPINWKIMGGLSLFLLLILVGRVHWLLQPR